jgi:hypothetical protein
MSSVLLYEAKKANFPSIIKSSCTTFLIFSFGNNLNSIVFYLQGKHLRYVRNFTAVPILDNLDYSFSCLMREKYNVGNSIKC